MVSDVDRIIATPGLKSEVNNSRSGIVMEWVWRGFSLPTWGGIWGGKIFIQLYQVNRQRPWNECMTVWEAANFILTPIIPVKTRRIMQQSQEQPLAKVGWTCLPSPPWRRPFMYVGLDLACTC